MCVCAAVRLSRYESRSLTAARVCLLSKVQTGRELLCRLDEMCVCVCEESRVCVRLLSFAGLVSPLFGNARELQSI